MSQLSLPIDLPPDEGNQAAIDWLAVADLVAGIYQPRQQFDDEKLEALRQSIAQLGILQPLIVRELSPEQAKRFGAHYEIIAGERRFRAAQQLGLERVPCWVRHYQPQTAATVALVENLQRADLNVVEVARGYERLIQEFGLTHQQIAEKVGCSRSAVSNTLRLLGLSAPVLSALANGQIEMAHGRALLSLDNMAQSALLGEIIQRGLSVREVERRVRQSALLKGTAARRGKTVDAEVAYLERRLSEQLGHEVQIEYHGGRGRLIVHYADLDDLDGLLERLGYERD